MTRSKAEAPTNPRDPSGTLAAVRAQIEAHPEVPIPEDPKANEGLPPVTQLRRFDTHRLLPAKYSVNYESVLTRIADNDEHLQEIFQLDNATNARLEAEENLRPGITQRELVFNIPNYRIVNAPLRIRTRWGRGFPRMNTEPGTPHSNWPPQRRR